MEERYKLYQGDCIEVMDKLISERIKVDMILTDPPYGTVNGIKGNGMEGKVDWDTKLDTKQIFYRCEKLLREKGCLLLFSQDPFTIDLIENANNNLPFSYRNIWVKDHFANGLMAKKAPVNYYEDMCVFFRKYDLYNENPLREYFKEVLNYIGAKSCKDINKELGHRRAEHCFYIDSTQFKLCTENVYYELTNTFKLRDFNGYIEYDKLQKMNKKYEQTFNLPKGKKVKSNVFTYKKDYDGYHPTQKPVALLEDLISTYTNNDNIVLDFTMGSGSTGVACMNTNRKFIGIELDDKYFDISKKRIENAYINR